MFTFIIIIFFNSLIEFSVTVKKLFATVVILFVFPFCCRPDGAFIPFAINLTCRTRQLADICCNCIADMDGVSYVFFFINLNLI